MRAGVPSGKRAWWIPSVLGSRFGGGAGSGGAPDFAFLIGSALIGSASIVGGSFRGDGGGV
jgi:hypothetical protein